MADPVKENTDSVAQDGARLGAQSSVTASKDTSTREKKRKRPSGALPPLPIYNRAALEAHRAEKIARARIDQQETRLVVGGRQRMTRKAAAVLRNEDGGAAAARASEQTDPKQWEKVALKEMFGIGFDSQSDTAAEVSSSEDSEYVDKPRCPNSEVADDSSSQISVDDEPEEESERSSSDGDAGEDVESAAAAYTESSKSDAESTPNLHQNTPNLRRSYDLRVKRAIPSWFRGFKATYKSWHRFHKAFDIFQFDSFQRFTNRTTTSVATRNKQIVSLSRARKRAGKQSRKEVTLIPEEWQMYSKTMVCTHGQPYEPKGKGKRRHNNIRDTKCKARVNVRVTVTVSGSWYLRVNGSGEHNHALTKHSYDNYAQNRTVKDPQLTDDVAILHKAGANAHGILQYLRERTDKKTKLKDVHNMVQRYKMGDQASLNDAQRAYAVLDGFTEQDDGNVAQVYVDSESNVARIATFQTARMKRLFKAFPEVVLVDSTHNTNANRYKLFSFVVHDVFGKGQYVHHALVDSEEKDNLRRVVEIFKENNPDWPKVRIFTTDKAMHEKHVLREEFPEARQLLCQWHVITWFSKQATRLAPGVKEDAKRLLRELVYAKNAEEYETLKGTLLSKLGNDKLHKLYQTFMDNWDGNKDEWVSYLRGNVPHLTNNTNNRIESKWGKLKELIDGSLSIDQLLSTLIALQQYAEEQYLAEYHRIGSRPTRECEDEDLTRLAGHVSPFAVGLLADEHTLATGPNADYKLEHIASGNINVTSLKTGNVHEVNTRTCSCSCIFMKTCLLPCRHVMYVRSVSNFESVLPPIRFFRTRWIVQSPENNIDEGEVPTGGFRQSTCTSRPKTRGLSGGKMYCEAKAITEKIIGRMALQSTPTFRVALKWLEDFYEALNGGTVVDFAENEGKTLFPGLSQVSSVGEAGFSQLSFADLPSQRRGVSSNAAETAEGVDTCMAADASDSSEDNEDEGAVSAVSENTKVPEYGTGATTASGSQTEDDNTERTESTPKTTRSKSTSPQEDTAAHERAKAVSWSFADRPRVNGMTKAQRKRAQAKEDSRKARVIAAIYRKGRLTRFVEFHEVAALLDGPYSFYYSKAMVDALVIPNVEVHGELSLKPYAIGQDVPRITKILQLPVIMEAIEAIKGKDDIDLLAFWPDYGYATFDQLDAMARLIEARGRFILVMKTHKWIDETEWRVADVREPFFDMTHVTKNEHKGYVETLNLSVIRAPGEVVEGYRLLDFRENLWLHTTSILISMMVLRAQYPGVGIINPSYQDFALPDQRRRVAGGFGAADPKYDRVIGIFNISYHWVAYLINRNIDHATNKASCFMFDPMQSDHHYKIIEKSVRGGIEELLQLQDSIDYTKIEWCKQKDGTSCGVWCIAVLEMLLSNGSWDDCLYRLQPYLRMRFLHKAIAFVEKEAAIMQLPL